MLEIIDDRELPSVVTQNGRLADSVGWRGRVLVQLTPTGGQRLVFASPGRRSLPSGSRSHADEPVRFAKAVAVWQEDHGLASTGMLDISTWLAMQRVEPELRTEQSRPSALQPTTTAQSGWSPVLRDTASEFVPIAFVPKVPRPLLVAPPPTPTPGAPPDGAPTPLIPALEPARPRKTPLTATEVQKVKQDQPLNLPPAPEAAPWYKQARYIAPIGLAVLAVGIGGVWYWRTRS